MNADNAGVDNVDDGHDADASSSENVDPDDTYAQNDPALLSGVVHSYLDIVSLVVYVNLNFRH